MFEKTDTDKVSAPSFLGIKYVPLFLDASVV